MNNKKMKKQLKKIDDLAIMVSELMKEFDMGNLADRVSDERLKVVDKIGRKSD